MYTKALTMATRKFTNVAPERPVDNQILTVISYNILADKYANSGVHSYATDKQLAWSIRWPRILEELRGYGADIICLQEVERPVFEKQLLPAFAEYEGLYYGRVVGPNDPVAGPEEGVALLTRRGRLEVLAHEIIRFADHIPEYASGASREVLAAREDGAIVTLLRDTRLQRVFVTATAHLHWDPRWPDVKLLQAQILSERVGVFLPPHRTLRLPVPVLLAGDFNSLWRKIRSDPFDEVPEGGALTSGVYDLLTTGKVSHRHQDHPLQRSKWRGAPEPLWKQVEIVSGLAPLHNAYSMKECEPPLTTKTATFAGNLDYIWLGWGWAVAELLALPYEARPGADASEVTALAPMPNDEFPSDHLALGVRLMPPCDMFSL